MNCVQRGIRRVCASLYYRFWGCFWMPMSSATYLQPYGTCHPFARPPCESYDSTRVSKIYPKHFQSLYVQSLDRLNKFSLFFQRLNQLIKTQSGFI